MKFMTFSDLHGDFDTLRKLVKRAQRDDIELVVCAGDFTVFERDIKEILRRLDEIGKTVLMIPGNHESPEILTKLFGNYGNLINLHKKIWEKNNVKFLGWGTDGFDRESEDFRDLTEKWIKLIGMDEKLVLVTHAPPRKTRLDLLGDNHVGNIDIRIGIKKLKPKIAISGHIHENEGQQDMIGETLVVNPGWKGMIMEV